jgi:ATP-binding cassette subfamily C protein
MLIDIERLVAKPSRSVIRASLEPLLLVPLGPRVLVILGLFASGIVEMLGLAMIVPLLATVSFGSGSMHTGSFKTAITQTYTDVLGAIGLSPEIGTLVLLVVGILSLKSAITIVVMRYVGDLMAEITRSVRMEVIRRLLNASWKYFSAQPMARLVNGAGAETGSIGESFLCSATILSTCIQALTYLAICVLISWHLSIVAAAICVVMFLMFGTLVRVTRQAAKMHSRRLREMAASFTDTILGMKPIKAMGRQALFEALYEADAQQLRKTMRTKVVSSEFSGELQEPIVAGLLCAGLYLATSQWHLQLHEQIVVGMLLIRLVASFTQIQRIFHRMASIQDMYRSVGVLIKEAIRNAERVDGDVTPTLKQSIELRDVTIGYTNKIIVRNSNLTLKAGLVTALIGPSGVGKSTIVDVVIGLRDPIAGAVLVDQVDMKTIDPLQWRRMIGYVPQEIMLFNDTILNNVTLREPGFSEKDVVEALRAAGAMSFVEERAEGLHYSVGERGHRLSGGQRQRIAIARALVRNPALLILDEATAGLDKQTELEICNSIIELARNRKLTVVTISHHPIWAAVSDEVYLVSEGEQGEGAQVQLMSQPEGGKELPRPDLARSLTRAGMPR